MKILITGSEGSLAQIVIPYLLEEGHKIIGVDNFMRYGIIERKRKNKFFSPLSFIFQFKILSMEQFVALMKKIIIKILRWFSIFIFITVLLYKEKCRKKNIKFAIIYD